MATLQNLYTLIISTFNTLISQYTNNYYLSFATQIDLNINRTLAYFDITWWKSLYFKMTSRKSLISRMLNAKTIKWLKFTLVVAIKCYFHPLSVLLSYPLCEARQPHVWCTSLWTELSRLEPWQGILHTFLGQDTYSGLTVTVATQGMKTNQMAELKQ